MSIQTFLALTLLAAGMLTASAEAAPQQDTAPLAIQEQGSFAAGGTVNSAKEPYDPLHPQAAGQTLHGDHASVFYQKPVHARKYPLVFLHGAGQSARTWESTPDGREGFQNLFLRRGYSVYLVDQPRRGKAGRSTVSMNVEATPDEQFWFGQFRMGLWPDFFENTQFARGEKTLDQFFRQMTPNTGDFDQALDASALGSVLEDVYEMTGSKSIFVTHSQGGAVGWDVPAENIAAIIAIEPGGTPQAGSEQYQKLLEADIPIIIYFGDYIDNGPEDVMSTGFWQSVRDGAIQFAESYNGDGGDCTVVNLPDEGITGNSHFMFQELNNDVIADNIEAWLKEKGLG